MKLTEGDALAMLGLAPGCDTDDIVDAAEELVFKSRQSMETSDPVRRVWQVKMKRIAGVSDILSALGIEPSHIDVEVRSFPESSDFIEVIRHRDKEIARLRLLLSNAAHPSHIISLAEAILEVEEEYGRRFLSAFADIAPAKTDQKPLRLDMNLWLNEASGDNYPEFIEMLQREKARIINVLGEHTRGSGG